MKTIQCQYCHGVIKLTTSINGVTTCPHCGGVNAVPKLETLPEAYAAILQGQISLAACKFEEAKVAFEHAIQFDDMEPSAYFGLALANFKVQFLRDEVNDCWQPICYEISDKVFTDDSNYRKALELATVDQKKVYRKQGQEIDDVRDEFYHLQASGLDYDCFLCVKVTDNGQLTQDSHTANDVYYHLKDKGYKPFYSEREIKGRTGAAYEALILYALVKSECMLIVCSNGDYLNTVWVKNEYTRFMKMVDNNEKERDAITFVFDGTPIEKLPSGKKIQGINLQSRDAFSAIVDFVEKHTPRAKHQREEARKRVTLEAEQQKRQIEEQNKKLEELQRKLEEVTAISTVNEEQAQKAAAKEKRKEAEKKKLEESRRNPTLANYPHIDFSIGGTKLYQYIGNVKNVIIPQGVTDITHAFAGNTSIESVVIPDSVTNETAETFWGCTNLKSVTIPNGVRVLGRQMFHKCSSLVDITIPDSVIRICRNAFQDCAKLTVTIPDSIKEIEEAAFAGTNLTEVAIPPTITNISSGVFLNCLNLAKATIPNTVTEIGDSAFNGCGKLTNVTIPDSVQKLGYCAFGGCGLTSITIPNSVKKLEFDYFGNGPFANCTNLQTVTMPKRLAGLFNYKLKKIFKGCDLKSINFTFTD